MIFSPLHIKLGLIKNLLKHYVWMANVSSIFCIRFLAYPTRKSMQEYLMDHRSVHLCVIKLFVRAMNDKKTARLSFVDVMKNFLGNKKAGNHEDLVGNMLSTFHDLGC